MKAPTVTTRLALFLSLLTASSVAPAPTPELTGIPGLAGINSALPLSAFQLTAAPGLPTLASLNLTPAELLRPPRGLSARSYGPVGLHPRGAACIPTDFPLAVGPMSSYMWERTAVRAAYNYLRAMGETRCAVPGGQGATVFVEGTVDGYYVQVVGMAAKGSGAEEEGSFCEHVAFGMEAFMVRDAGCYFPMGGYVVNGGAGKAWGNGGLWVHT
ncbi:hypothetical protein QBC39DRAFT_378881 [Podospora conica]|nr:hypothetical protein QBC39DRAFT_378881 [Schizothecium conicum]